MNLWRSHTNTRKAEQPSTAHRFRAIPPNPPSPQVCNVIHKRHWLPVFHLAPSIPSQTKQVKSTGTFGASAHTHSRRTGHLPCTSVIQRQESEVPLSLHPSGPGEISASPFQGYSPGFRRYGHVVLLPGDHRRGQTFDPTLKAGCAIFFHRLGFWVLKKLRQSWGRGGVGSKGDGGRETGEGEMGP